MRSMLVVLLLSLLASCGTMLNGGPFMVPVSSGPPGAMVRYQGALVGTTPCQVAMYARDPELVISKDGDSKTIEVERGINWISPIGNGLLLLPVGLVGMIVDQVNGCHMVIVTDQVHVGFATRQPYKPYTEPTRRPAIATADRVDTPGPLTVLRFSSRSKLHGTLVTVERVDGMVVTVRAVDTGETDAIDVPFLPQVEAAKRALDAKAKLPLDCPY
jgi:hypothetical protein